MRIKIIGDNNCARATRHLLRMAGFAVTEYLPVDVVTQAPHSGYAITIDLAPLPSSGHTPDPSRECFESQDSKSALETSPTSAPDHSTHVQASVHEGASAISNEITDASSPAYVEMGADDYGEDFGHAALKAKGSQAEACATAARIHFDSVDSALEAAILRHVTQLAAAPVVVDRPGGKVHSERELRVIVPLASNAAGGFLPNEACMDEAAAVAVEFGVLRGLLDLVSPSVAEAKAEKSAATSGNSGSRAGKRWWTFGILIIAGVLLACAATLQAAPRGLAGVARRNGGPELAHAVEARGLYGAYLHLEAALPPAQGQFATGQPTKITDGANTLVIDPCKAQAKLYASINQTANTQLVAGTAFKKIYICSIHVVVAAATNVALVEGTGSVCATGTAGVSGFGGATAATGWNFAANSGIALGNGGAALGAEGTSADNLCLYNSGSGQVSGGISYVVQ